MSWMVYVLRCADDTLYTGITNDLERRLASHVAGKGAKYTQARGPFTLHYREAQPDRAAASRREHAIKSMTRTQKLALPNQNTSLSPACGGEG